MSPLPAKKRLFKFADLPADWQTEAIAKVARLAEARTRYNGEIWAESSFDLAAAATFEIARWNGRPCIWGVRFATEPRVVPGTEYHRQAA